MAVGITSRWVEPTYRPRVYTSPPLSRKPPWKLAWGGVIDSVLWCVNYHTPEFPYTNLFKAKGGVTAHTHNRIGGFRRIWSRSFHALIFRYLHSPPPFPFSFFSFIPSFFRFFSPSMPSMLLPYPARWYGIALSTLKMYYLLCRSFVTTELVSLLLQ